MKRRDFLELAALGSAVPLLSPGSAPCRRPPGADIEPIAGPGELDELSVAELQAAMVGGHYTSRRLVELYPARVAAVDAFDGDLRAVLEINPDALAIADQMDRERTAGRVRGPLHGIPVMIKDDIDTDDRMMTTAGALAAGPRGDVHRAVARRASAGPVGVRQR